MMVQSVRSVFWSLLPVLAFASIALGDLRAEPGPQDAPTPTPAPAPAVKHTYVVAAMGDSLTDPKSQGGKYLEYLKERCPKSRFDSWGKGGQMVKQMRKRFARDVLGEGSSETKPTYTHVIILGGIADVGSNETAGRTTQKIEDDLGAMYRMASERGIKVVAMTMPPWGGFNQYNEERHKMTLEVNEWI